MLKPIMFKDDDTSHVTEASEASSEQQILGRRRSLLALAAIVATAGCDGSASVRDTGYDNYAYYGRSNYYRSPGTARLRSPLVTLVDVAIRVGSLA